jgi:hypothetical protein
MLQRNSLINISAAPISVSASTPIDLKMSGMCGDSGRANAARRQKKMTQPWPRHRRSLKVSDGETVLNRIRLS